MFRCVFVKYDESVKLEQSQNFVKVVSVARLLQTGVCTVVFFLYKEVIIIHTMYLEREHISNF